MAFKVKFFFLLVTTLVLLDSGVLSRKSRVRRAPGYPFTKPVITSQGIRYKFGVIADLDKWSKVTGNGSAPAPKNEWISRLITGTLYLNYNTTNLKDANITIEWEEDEPEILKGGLSYDGRGQELSELIVFDNHLLTMDDRTGIVYRLLPRISKDQTGNEWNQVPWLIIPSGDGTLSRGFKCEWATVKDGNLWIGSHGTQPKLRFVKEITPKGEVKHHDWSAIYDKMAEAVGVKPPGYVIHEAAGWSDFHKKWVFIPRKVSQTEFTNEDDEKSASNKIIIADADFNNVQLHGMAGELMPTHGVSSFKWLPLRGTNSSYIVAIKAEEINDGKDQATYILAFDMDGNVLFPETKIEDSKYEGIEFL